MDLTKNCAEVKKYEIFCRHVVSEIPTNDDTWVKLGESEFKPLPISCTFIKVNILNFTVEFVLIVFY